MIYRNIQNNEYNILAELHIKAFPDFFLTSLGRSFLNTYYKACLKSKKSIAICAVDNDQLVGFSIGCTLSKGYHKQLIINNFLSFLVQMVKILFTKPFAILRLLFNLEKNEHIEDDGNYAELLSIAVDPNQKGTGVGKQLIQKFESEACQRSCKKMTLTTDVDENEDVIEFYKKRDYQLFYEFKAYPNRKMYKFIKILVQDNFRRFISL